MNTSGKKAKGRSLVLEIKQWLLRVFPHLADDDIIVPATSSSGEDLKLSPLARSVFPYSCEMKRQEGLGKVYGFMEQASSNAGEYTPVVFMRSNHKQTLVLMKLCDWERLIKE